MGYLRAVASLLSMPRSRGNVQVCLAVGLCWGAREKFVDYVGPAVLFLDTEGRRGQVAAKL
jgi:hypothetical protein